jgi:hypothetical protein
MFTATVLLVLYESPVILLPLEADLLQQVAQLDPSSNQHDDPARSPCWIKVRRPVSISED